MEGLEINNSSAEGFSYMLCTLLHVYVDGISVTHGRCSCQHTQLYGDNYVVGLVDGSGISQSCFCTSVPTDILKVSSTLSTTVQQIQSLASLTVRYPLLIMCMLCMCSNNFNTSVTVEPTDDMYLGGLTHLLEVSFKIFV